MAAMLVPIQEIRELQEFIGCPGNYLPEHRKWPPGKWTVAGQTVTYRTWVLTDYVALIMWRGHPYPRNAGSF